MNDHLISKPWGPGLLVLLVVILVSTVFFLGAKKEILRDDDPKQPDFAERPYSMAKSQLAFWIVVVIGSFIFVYFSQGACTGVLNNTALFLLGISTGTTALSAVANAKPKQADDAQTPVASEGFLSDILSDNLGMNVHRLQMLIWTVVFGGIFIHQVVSSGKFPEFDNQAYVLMGISSATYVWFKRSES